MVFNSYVNYSTTLFHIIFSFTSSVIFFVYATIMFVIILIAVINIQPYKNAASCYPSTDTIFIVLLSLACIDLTGRCTGNRQKNFYAAAMLITTFVSFLIPVVYILFLIASWLLSRSKCSKSLVCF